MFLVASLNTFALVEIISQINKHKMKKLFLILTIAITLFSCKDKDDVESFTILGDWEVDSYRENGQDMTTLFKTTFKNYILKFDASNNYIETYMLFDENITNAGDWELINGGDDLELTSQVDSSKRFLDIVELNSLSATITEDSGSKSYNLRKI